MLREALALFPGRAAMLSSFEAEAAVSLAILAQVAPDTPVLFLDTGMHFAQTLDYRRALQTRLGLTDVRDLATPAAHPRDRRATSTPTTPTLAARCARWSPWRRRPLRSTF